MTLDLGRLTPIRKSGTEQFHEAGKPLSFDVLSFWRWSTSDLLSNATRGVLAEYIVARALDANPDGVRDEWAAFDLATDDGIKIEVKSAAFLQSWYQAKLSRISFRTPKTRAWDPYTSTLNETPSRQAQVYVFALLAHKDKQTVDPLDLSQWLFYVLPTSVLDHRTRSQHSITLPTLEGLAGDGVRYSDLAVAVRAAAAQTSGDSPSGST